MPKVAVVDYGSSNLRSVAKALEHVANGEHEVIVSSDRQVILNADRIVFPGQGAIGDCMRSLEACDLVEVFVNLLRAFAADSDRVNRPQPEHVIE